MSQASDSDRERSALSRRDFLKGAGGVAATGVIGSRAGAAAEASAASQDAGASAALEGATEITLRVNGAPVKVTVEPRTTLLDALRVHAEPALTGTKLVCDRGNCGACTVLLDDQPVYSCLTLAVQAVGREVRTVEGLAQGGNLSPVQQAMLEKDALMCGFCTPGFTMSLTACLERDPGADLDQIKRSCSGNLCRCGTYPHIFEAGLEAGRQMKGGR